MLSHHIEDGRVWAVDKRTGEKRRVKRHIIRYSRHLVLAPSARAADTKAAGEKPKPKRKQSTRRKQVTEPAKSPEPDTTEPVTEPETTDTPDSKES
ncbi:hypothetical protein [Nesterenkonia sp. K-15-9-6]|uniref:hypothetical protein n=1 Tax=Nesterenkonia sp. K-15-9-6 TaxID=3093918 RepID=UPI004044AA01